MKICLVALVLLPLVSPSVAFIPSYLSPGSGPPQFDQLPAHLRPQKQQPMSRYSVQDSLDNGVIQSYFNSPFLEEDGEEEEDCSPMPNNTKNQPAFFQCNDDSVFTLHGGAVTNLTGDDSYPVSFASPIRIFLDVTSEAKRRYDNIGVDVSLYKRSTGWFGCGWMFLPNFGMLSTSDMCYDNPSCPLSPGRQVIEFSIDPSRIFSRLFRMIHYDLSAYQLVIRLKDNNDPFRDLLCTTIQLRIHL